MFSTRHLILGGARSGKTRLALKYAHEWSERGGRGATYIATAQALDAEMSERVARHRAERPAHWRTIEASSHLADAIAAAGESTVVIVDCMTLWLTKALLRDFDESDPRCELPTWTDERDAFVGVLKNYAGEIVIVSNEVGGGIVPMSALARRFQDEQGWLNQSVAAVCDRVSLVVAGIEVPVKR
jgi:adenosylcobinamide kinase / adenosylcobinamide-phosphate guanylyltransferase